MSHVASDCRRRRAPSGRPIVPMVLLALGLSACVHMTPREAGEGAGLAEPEVFEVLRASNSRSVLDAVARRYEQERRHIELLEQQIQQLVAAQAGLNVALDGAREDFALAQEEAGSLDAELATMDQRVAETRTRAETEREALTAAEAERDAAVAARDAATAELAAATAELETARTQHDALRDDLVRARVLVEKVKDDRVAEEIESLRAALERLQRALAEK